MVIHATDEIEGWAGMLRRPNARDGEPINYRFERRYATRFAWPGIVNDDPGCWRLPVRWANAETSLAHRGTTLPLWVGRGNERNQ